MMKEVTSQKVPPTRKGSPIMAFCTGLLRRRIRWRTPRNRITVKAPATMGDTTQDSSTGTMPASS